MLFSRSGITLKMSNDQIVQKVSPTHSSFEIKNLQERIEWDVPSVVVSFTMTAQGGKFVHFRMGSTVISGQVAYPRRLRFDCNGCCDNKFCNDVQRHGSLHGNCPKRLKLITTKSVLYSGSMWLLVLLHHDWHNEHLRRLFPGSMADQS